MGEFQVDQYTILDTSTMLRFSCKFLEHFGYENVEYIEAENFKKVFGRSYDLFVSFICLSETPHWYREKILSNTLPNTKSLFVIDGHGPYRKNLSTEENTPGFNNWLTNTIRWNFPRFKKKRSLAKIHHQEFQYMFIGKK